MNSKNMLTIFDLEWLELVHMYKDVGMIPIYLKKKYGINQEIVFYENAKNIDLKSEFENIRLKKIKKNFVSKFPFLKKYLNSMVFYLVKSSKNKDILMLYHIKKENFIYKKIYKCLNPKGKVYLKLDIDKIQLKIIYENYLEGNSKYWFKSLNKIKKKIRNIKLIRELSSFDIISAETQDTYEIMSILLKNEAKLIKLENGFDNSKISLENRDKENIILTVGRIGSYQKNTEMFLKALEKVDLKDWKVYIVGKIEDTFKCKIDKYFEEASFQKEKIFFLDEIKNREYLYNLYKKSKVFCLTSRWEGFPLVFLEAISFGTYIISTKVGAERDIIIDEKMGKIIEQEDYIELRKEIIRIIDLKNPINNSMNYRLNFAKDNFSWEFIVEKLYNKLIE